ncbi:MAG: dihydropteroate synthase [Holosporaceae bacterium]|jgi:2-amino-4-hydroxy-6-hydroxymethyldihydropteridine diphosphokinase/dihydropteroate synthase|nr:dihydropteroate synthase [Holosporaceae bacterium]
MNGKYKKTALLALGTNCEDRLQNLRSAVSCLPGICRRSSHVIETRAQLPDNAPAEWDRPYLNMLVVLELDTNYSPEELLSALKAIEEKLGRDLTAPRWSPRVIDLDILLYEEAEINSDSLIIPHPELKNRDFLQFLMESIGYEIPEKIKMNTNGYTPLRHYALYPRLVGILNVTPDSFSDAGKFLDPEMAEQHARQLLCDGAYIIDIGAQSTRPGYVEVPPSEEISRLAPVLERCSDVEAISVDTYFDDVVKYVLERRNVKWINDQASALEPETIKLIADRGVKLVVMQHGADPFWLEDRLKYLRNLGLKNSNIIIDPGIGFGKTKYQNLYIIKRLKTLRRYGCAILLGASRKSFLANHSTVAAPDRDIESISVACYAKDAGIDYLRIHNVADHMRFFVTKHCIENA